MKNLMKIVLDTTKKKKDEILGISKREQKAAEKCIQELISSAYVCLERKDWIEENELSAFSRLLRNNPQGLKRVLESYAKLS